MARAWTLPLDASALRIVTGDPAMDQRLVSPRVKRHGDPDRQPDRRRQPCPVRPRHRRPAGAARRYGARRLWSGGAGRGAGVALTDLGSADAEGRITFKFGNGAWTLDAQLEGRMVRVDNATLTTLAGSDIRFGGHFRLGQRPAAAVRTRDAERQQAGAGARRAQPAGRAHDADRAGQAGRLWRIHGRGGYCQRRPACGADFRRSAARRRAQGCARGACRRLPKASASKRAGIPRSGHSTACSAFMPKRRADADRG